MSVGRGQCQSPIARCPLHIASLLTAPWHRKPFLDVQVEVWLSPPQAEGTTGYDALTQTSDGRTREVEMGYERPASGPTTNFVGNHMTQVRTFIPPVGHLKRHTFHTYLSRCAVKVVSTY